MKEKHYLIITILFVIIQSCSPKFSTVIGVVEDSRNTDQIDHSLNQIVIQFGDSWTAEQKNTLRDEFFVIDSTKCPCNNDAIELWTINTDSLDIEGALRNLNDRSDGGEDVEGDHQFEFEMASAGDFDSQVPPINLELASNSSNKVNIAIIDTGINSGYFDSTFILYDTRRNDNCLEEFSGWNFIDNTPNLNDTHGHGTYVTKIITSELRKKGIESQILPIKAFDNRGKGTYWSVLCSMSYIKQFQNMHIVNASFGGGLNNRSDYDQDILKKTIDELSEIGVLVLTSAGNSGKNNDTEGNEHHPSGYTSDNIIAVGGYSNTPILTTDNIVNNINISDISNYGTTSIDIAAPFGNYSIARDTVNIRLSGTSYSTAYTTFKVAEIINSSDFSILPIEAKNELLNRAPVSNDLISFIKQGKVIIRE